GAIFLEDVDAIPDGTGVADLRGNRVVRGARPDYAQVGLHRAATIRLGGPGRQLILPLFAGWQVDDRQGAAEEAADVFANAGGRVPARLRSVAIGQDRKSTRLNSSHQIISYAVF